MLLSTRIDQEYSCTWTVSAYARLVECDNSQTPWACPQVSTVKQTLRKDCGTLLVGQLNEELGRHIDVIGLVARTKRGDWPDEPTASSILELALCSPKGAYRDFYKDSGLVLFRRNFLSTSTS
jgi:hypothetical protein